MTQVAVGLSGGYVTEDYSDSIVGLTDRDMFNGTLDISYSPMEKLSLYGYATYEDMKYKQAGCDFSGSSDANKTTCFYTPSDTSLDWEIETHDKVWTLGTGFQASIIDNKLTFGADYSFSRGTTSYDPEAGSAVGGVLPPPPLPDLLFRIHSVNLHLDYKPREDVSVRFAYLFENLSSKDFGLDEVDVDTVSDVIGLGEDSPDYTAHVFGVSVAYRF